VERISQWDTVYFVQALERSFAILRALAGRSSSVSVGEIARLTELPKSTVSRTLVALEEQGAVDRLDAAGHYVIGAGLAALSANASPVRLMRDLARPELAELSAALGEACAVAVLDGDEVLFVETSAAEGVVQVQDWIGVRFPLHVVAAGLALLSTWPDDDVARYAAGGLEKSTEQSVGTVAGLKRRVGEVRSCGFAWTIQEYSDEINGLAAPVRVGDARVVGAITAYGPEYRFPGSARDRTLAERALVAAAERISAGLATR